MSFYGPRPRACVYGVQASAVIDLECTDLLAILNSYVMYEGGQRTIAINGHCKQDSFVMKVYKQI